MPSAVPAEVRPDDESRVDRVTGYIVRSLRTGNLATGQRLVEVDFMTKLGVSRSVVREAFQRLIADGLLETERHRGVRIRELTAADFAQAMAVRGALDGLAAQLATPRLQANPHALIACHARLAEAVSQLDVSRFITLNHEFHELIVRAADNTVLSDAVRRLGNTIHQVEAKVPLGREVMIHSVQEHGEIVNAILRGDAQAARLAAESHQSKAAELIRSLQA